MTTELSPGRPRINADVVYGIIRSKINPWPGKWSLPLPVVASKSKMSSKPFLKDTTKLSKLSMVIIFMALVRCIGEPFRLHYYAISGLTFDDIKPFLLGAMASAIGLLAMTILSWFGKNRLIIMVCVLVIAVLLMLKFVYLSP